MSGKRTYQRNSYFDHYKFCHPFYGIFLSHFFGSYLWRRKCRPLSTCISCICPWHLFFLCRNRTCSFPQVAQATCSGHPEKAKELLKTGLIFTFVLSCILTIFLQQKFAPFLACSVLGAEMRQTSDFIFLYVFPFGAIHSCISGYSLGLKDTKIPASSQLLEQTLRILVFLLLVCY